MTPAEQIQAELYETFIRDTVPAIPLHTVTLDTITTDTLNIHDLATLARELEPLGYTYDSHGISGATFRLQRPAPLFAKTGD